MDCRGSRPAIQAVQWDGRQADAGQRAFFRGREPGRFTNRFAGSKHRLSARIWRTQASCLCYDRSHESSGRKSDKTQTSVNSETQNERHPTSQQACGLPFSPGPDRSRDGIRPGSGSRPGQFRRGGLVPVARSTSRWDQRRNRPADRLAGGRPGPALVGGGHRPRLFLSDCRRRSGLHHRGRGGRFGHQCVFAGRQAPLADEERSVLDSFLSWGSIILYLRSGQTVSHECSRPTGVFGRSDRQRSVGGGYSGAIRRQESSFGGSANRLRYSATWSSPLLAVQRVWSSR